MINKIYQKGKGKKKKKTKHISPTWGHTCPYAEKRRAFSGPQDKKKNQYLKKRGRG